MSRFSSIASGAALVVLHAACACAQDAVQTAGQQRAERLAEMKQQAAEYTLTLAGESSQRLALHEEPVLRFDNAVSGVPDGIAVMWKEGKRPAVFAQVFQTKEGAWIHECQSLASAGFQMQRRDKSLWQPEKGAGDFRPLAGGPPADQSPVKRLSQMRAIAEQFSATDEFKIHFSDRETTKHTLRLLPTPVYRYSDPSLEVADAAVFAFVHGTDPEVFLVLELRTGERSGWLVAFCPMTCWEVNVMRDGKVVWSSPERLGKSKPNEPYHVWVHKP
jgi:hypothetical protein